MLINRRYQKFTKRAPCRPNIDEPMKEAEDRKAALTSFYKLFCPKCLIYSCPFHSKKLVICRLGIVKISTKLSLRSWGWRIRSETENWRRRTIEAVWPTMLECVLHDQGKCWFIHTERISDCLMSSSYRIQQMKTEALRVTMLHRMQKVNGLVRNWRCWKC